MKPYTVVVVGCGVSKVDSPAPARDLYTSTLFRLSMAYAERIGDDVVIASAEHGLLHIDEVIEPYERRLAASEALSWARSFCTALVARLIVRSVAGERKWEHVRVVMLAGRAYTDPIRTVLDTATHRCREHGDVVPSYQFEEPLRGLQIGERLRWLRRQLDAGVN